MRKHCNFTVPKPFVVLSTRALRRNGYRKYIIYPDLSHFKKACLNCALRHVENKRSSCAINDNQFMLKFYGLDMNLPKGIYMSLGAVPLDLKPYPLAVGVKAYLKNHRQKPKRRARLRAINKSLADRAE
jgi:hypothetical protein